MPRTNLSPQRSALVRLRGHLLWLLPAVFCGLCLTGSQASTRAEARKVAESPRYTLTDLGHLGYGYSGAYGINESGQVVGTSPVSTGPNRAFIWKPTTPNGTTGQMVSLGTLFPNGNSNGRDINDKGQVVGNTVYASGGASTAMLWTPTVLNGTSGSMVRLTDSLGGNYPTDAYAINPDGKVVGVSEEAAGRATRAIFWQSNGKALLYGSLPDDQTWANGVNKGGQVVGWETDPDRNFRAALWGSGAVADLGDLGGPWSIAHDINDMGQVVGQAKIPGNNGAFIWEAGQIRHLGLEDGSASNAFGINNKGQVVGQHRGDAAVLWEDGLQINLNTLIPPGSGWVLSEAQDINEKGQIVGSGTNAEGLPRAFLLTPLPPAKADISVTAATAPFAARAGTDFTFTRTVRNTGPDPATEIKFLETLPAGLAFRSAQSTQGTLLHDGNLVAFTLGTLARQTTATITITVHPNASGPVTLSAGVTSPVSDPNLANNLSDTSITVLRGVANLGLVLTAKPQPVKVGETLDYTLTATNHGPARASGVTLTNTLPAGADFVSASSGAGTFVRSGNTITFTFPVMEVSREDDFPPDKWDAVATIVVRTKAVGTLRYSAQVRAAQSDEPSPDPHPNSATVDATVSPLAGPDLTGEWGAIKYTYNKKKKVSKLSGAFTVRNAGNLPSGATQLRFFLSDDQFFDNSDTPAYQLAVPAIEAGMTWTKRKKVRGKWVELPITFTFKVPRGNGGGSLVAGKFAILVIAPSAVAETNANNNMDVSAALP